MAREVSRSGGYTRLLALVSCSALLSGGRELTGLRAGGRGS
jgi:hypothetical protein